MTATLAGADSWADVERFGVTHQDWFANISPSRTASPPTRHSPARLASGEFLTALHRWIDDFSESLRGQGIAIDGKTLRGSHDARHGQSPWHTITAFACGTRTVLRQMSVPDKSNEIPSVPLLLEMLYLGHGRKERRSYYVLGASKKDADVLCRWPGLRSIGLVIRQRWVKGVEQTETTLFVSSREPKVRETARLLRGHWGIENSQH